MSVIGFLKNMFGRAPVPQNAPTVSEAAPVRTMSVGRASSPAGQMTPDFLQLSVGWNADPNAPEPNVKLSGADILLDFFLNADVYQQFREDERGTLRFRNCSRYRLGSTNDEGWYRGQCRYSQIAPGWGEFYELTGDDLLKDAPDDWIVAGSPEGHRHFLFYFRDETFECFADDWLIERDDRNPLYRVICAGA